MKLGARLISFEICLTRQKSSDQPIDRAAVEWNRGRRLLNEAEPARLFDAG